MGPPQRQRYNAKARSSVAGGSSHKKRRSHPTKEVNEDGEAAAAGPRDANREVIVPQEELEWREKERLRKEVSSLRLQM